MAKECVLVVVSRLVVGALTNSPLKLVWCVALVCVALGFC